jgi:hypothetical protein
MKTTISLQSFRWINEEEKCYTKRNVGYRLLQRKLRRSLIDFAVIIDITMMMNDRIDITLHSMTVLAQDMRSLFHNYSQNFALLQLFTHSTQNSTTNRLQLTNILLPDTRILVVRGKTAQFDAEQTMPPLFVGLFVADKKQKGFSV